MDNLDKDISFNEFFEIYKQEIAPEVTEIEKLRISKYNEYKKQKKINMILVIIILPLFIFLHIKSFPAGVSNQYLSIYMLFLLLHIFIC